MIENINETVERVHDMLVEHLKETDDYQNEGRATMAKIDVMHSQSLVISNNVPYLGVLPGMAKSIDDMKNSVLAAAIGSDRVEKKTLTDIIKANNRTYLIIISVLLAVVLLLMAFFTGLAIQYPDIFKALRGVL